MKIQPIQLKSLVKAEKPQWAHDIPTGQYRHWNKFKHDLMKVMHIDKYDADIMVLTYIEEAKKQYDLATGKDKFGTTQTVTQYLNETIAFYKTIM